MEKFFFNGLVGAMVAAMVMFFSGTASAGDWNFYGSARVQTFITDTDNKGAPDTKNFDQTLQSNSRIGSKVTVSDELTGLFEYGTGVNIRQLYGEWDFGAGKFLVGQTYSPLNMSLSNQVYGSDEDLNSYGNPYAGRQAMLRLTLGNFQIAGIEPDTDTLGVAGASTEVRIPKIEASYRLDLDKAYLLFAGGYQTYEIYDPATATAQDVDSYIAALGGHMTFGPIYFAGNLYVAQNTGPYNLASAADDMPTLVGTNFIDNESLGYILVGGMKLNDTLSFEVGYGYTQAELDQAGSRKDDVASYYLQSTVNLAEGVFFVPEIGVIDHKKDQTGMAQSEILYYGIKWQINF